MFLRLLVYIVVFVLVVCFCPPSVHVVATFPGTVLFPLLCSVLQFFCLMFLFLDPQDEVGPFISSKAVLCFFVLLVYIVVFVLVVCLCPPSVHVVATFPGTVLFPLLCSVLPFFA